ncbi:uncharacterized protein BDR25DRAFT_358151 [Lindgomyces ingoldianus]|uniref:Uncharacterized protein n=1 Tax=Lindgomyces ingoldianus TaxID=673940 RepID=A0ACB6QP06_9PLEO|nr:uncharacterized protein BDR25DRAFT_358151 [Lindgomyces ingoldianus]KAF2467886.1 hypothetical protein BDR25DRAFT_358151 [Lindgomyces ingoldianus]
MGFHPLPISNLDSPLQIASRIVCCMRIKVANGLGIVSALEVAVSVITSRITIANFVVKAQKDHMLRWLETPHFVSKCKWTFKELKSAKSTQTVGQENVEENSIPPSVDSEDVAHSIAFVPADNDTRKLLGYALIIATIDINEHRPSDPDEYLAIEDQNLFNTEHLNESNNENPVEAPKSLPNNDRVYGFIHNEVNVERCMMTRTEAVIFSIKKIDLIDEKMNLTSPTSPTLISFARTLLPFRKLRTYKNARILTSTLPKAN